jgi:hypothetical protein
MDATATRTPHRLSPTWRITLWLGGTGFASLLPVVSALLASVFGRERIPTWAEITGPGDFLLVAAVLSIGSLMELIRLFLEGRLVGQRLRLPAISAVGLAFLLVVDLPMYAFVAMFNVNSSQLNRATANPGVASIINFSTACMSPILLGLSLRTRNNYCQIDCRVR